MTSKENLIIPEIINTKDGKKLPSLQEIEKEYQQKYKDLMKNKSWLRWVVVGGVTFGSLFLASLVASHIINGAIAIGVAGLILGLGYFGYKAVKAYDPVLQQKMKNDAIRRMIEEAQEKKIETLTAYVKYLDDYLKEAKHLRNKVDSLIEKQKAKLSDAKDNNFLQKEYMKMLDNLTKTKVSIEQIIESSLDKKKKFEDILKISREKYDFIKETKDIVNFLENSGNVLDEILVDESLNQLEKEFAEISQSIKNLASDLENEK